MLAWMAAQSSLSRAAFSVTVSPPMKLQLPPPCVLAADNVLTSNLAILTTPGAQVNDYMNF